MTAGYLNCRTIRLILPESPSLVYDGRVISLKRGRQRTTAFGIPLVQSSLGLSSFSALTVDGHADYEASGREYGPTDR